MESQEFIHARDVAHGRLVVQCKVWAMPVAAVNEGLQGGLPSGRTLIGPGIGPLSQAGLHEALDLPLALGVYGRVRNCRMPSSAQAARKAFCSRADVRHDPLDAHCAAAPMVHPCSSTRATSLWLFIRLPVLRCDGVATKLPRSAADEPVETSPLDHPFGAQPSYLFLIEL